MSTVSCGNQGTEKDTLMIRRPKFDKSKQCVRCKERNGNVVVRHAVYCRHCFSSYVLVKFRRSLDSSVNPLPDGSRRKGLRAGGNVLLGMSGGLGSTVLLDLVHETYFSPDNTPIDEFTGKPRGGKDHPRNMRVWKRGAVCYVETCGAFPGARDRTEEVRSVVGKYPIVDFIPLRIEDAFSHDWWSKVGGTPQSDALGIDITNEDLLLSSIATSTGSKSPNSCLQKYIASLPTQTAISSTINVLTRLLLLRTAVSTGSSHLLLGTSLTSLSVSLISSIAQGGGFMVREETQEEWTPQSFSVMKENGHKDGVVRIIRPLRDIGMKECALWAWWRGLTVVGKEKIVGDKQSIGSLTKEFIVGLERDYPSTVSTITRTCAKLAPKAGTGYVCLLCERPAQSGLQNWKAQISIRSFRDSPESFPPHLSETHPTSAPTSPRSPSLTQYLCYSCHTTITSRSSRGMTVPSVSKDDPVLLPMWVTSNLTSHAAHEGPNEAFTQPLGNIQSVAQMKAVVADYLLDE